MNVASAVGFLSYEFETEILLSENASVFLHDQDPKPPSAGYDHPAFSLVKCLFNHLVGDGK
jgi:hypothetical protein